MEDRSAFDSTQHSCDHLLLVGVLPLRSVRTSCVGTPDVNRPLSVCCSADDDVQSVARMMPAAAASAGNVDHVRPLRGRPPYMLPV